MEGINPGDFGVRVDHLNSSYKKKLLGSGKLSFEVSQDIHNEKGVLLLKAGGKVDNKAFQNIVKHKLLKPIDECIQLKDQITHEKLLDNFEQIAASVFADQIPDFEDTLSVVDKIIAETDFDEIVLNKLTVFDMECHDSFDHGLATAFLSAMVGKRLNYSFQKLKDVFNAGLFHDIGEMFLDIDLHDSRSELTGEQFNKIKAHPIIAYSILKESKTKFSKDVLFGVLDHHERLDGSGYPRELSKEDINQIARILSVIDTFDAMLRKGRSIADILWGIKLYEGDDPKYRRLDGDICGVLYSFKDLFKPTDRSEPRGQPLTPQDLVKYINELKSLWNELSRLKNQIEAYANEASDPRQVKLLRNIGNNLFIIEGRIFSASGFAEIDEQDVLSDSGYANDLQKDVVRIAPELAHLFNQVNRLIAQAHEQLSTEASSELTTRCGSLKNRINEVHNALGRGPQ